MSLLLRQRIMMLTPATPAGYSVVYALTNVTSSNNDTTVAIGGSYTTTLTAATYYSISTVTVTMGGIDITATAYSNGVVTIANVTDAIVITATATWAMPFDAFIQYLESPGGSYIDTGMPASSSLNMSVEVYDYFKEDNKGLWLFGGRTSSSADQYGFFIVGTSGACRVVYGNTYKALSTYTSYTSATSVSLDATKIYIGNSSTNLPSRTFTSTYNVFLFCLNNGGSIAGSCKCKIGRVTMSNGTTTRNYIPVRIGQVGYFYDTVSQTLFGNQGSIPFTLGPDVV